jgi:hypothetical protein
LGIVAGDFNNHQAPDLAIPIQDDAKVVILLNTQWQAPVPTRAMRATRVQT